MDVLSVRSRLNYAACIIQYLPVYEHKHGDDNNFQTDKQIERLKERYACST